MMRDLIATGRIMNLRIKNAGRYGEQSWNSGWTKTTSMRELRRQIHHPNDALHHWAARQFSREALTLSSDWLDGPVQTLTRLSNMSNVKGPAAQRPASRSSTTRQSPAPCYFAALDTNRFAVLADTNDTQSTQCGPETSSKKSCTTSSTLGNTKTKAISTSSIERACNARKEGTNEGGAKKRRAAGIDNKSQQNPKVDPDLEEDRPEFLPEIQTVNPSRLSFVFSRPTELGTVVERTLVNYLRVEAAFRPRDPRLLEYLKQRAIRHLKRYDESTITPEQRLQIVVGSTAEAMVPSHEELEARLHLLNRRNVNRMKMMNEFLSSESSSLFQGLWRLISSNLVPQPLWTRFA